VTLRTDQIIMRDYLIANYLRLLDFPRALLGALGVVALVALYYATDFSFDASSDDLVVRGDPDLATYLRVSEQFGGDEFLLMTFAPTEGDALAPAGLAVLDELQQALQSVPGVVGVFSILDVPLLQSPPVPLTELADGFKTLRSPGVDLELARQELTGSPLFRDLLITADARTSAMRVDMALNGELLAVESARAALRVRERELAAGGKTLPTEQQARLDLLEARYDELRDGYLAARRALIAEVRGVRDDFRQHGELHLGGVPMIAEDMVAFVRSDLVVFGSTALVVVLVALYGFFRRLRWVLLPIGTSALTVLLTVGVLAAFEKPATVVSANFMALLTIITVALTIHLIVRYRELQSSDVDLASRELVRETMTSKFAPCLYNALTTMAAFASLAASRILPVEDFGLMMCLGIAIALVATFTFFPAVLLLLGKGQPIVGQSQDLALTRYLGGLARRRYVAISVVGLLMVVVAGVGISRVSMDNRFYEYFRENTDIYQGMRFVDQYLGGTIPVDVVIGFDPYEPYLDDEDDFFFDDEEDAYPERYWFTRDKLDRVLDMHRFLEAQPQLGKVVSVASLDLLARTFTDGEPLSGPEIAGVLGVLPDDLRGELLSPYAHPESGQFRLSSRVVESGPPFDRAELAAAIRQYAVEELGFLPERVEVTGMMVMFDTMLKQLFDSQVDTLVWVLLATLLMFLILLRSFTYAILGLLPNALAAACVIAAMGYAGVALDLMTITIAAISIGIGVDNAIHYLHRFRQERALLGDVRLALERSHATIGHAMYFTTITVIVGFSVLVLSNFVPTVLFGLFTVVAMALAFMANLILLPSLLMLVLAPARRPVAAN
jgi:uncharacterized protein